MKNPGHRLSHYGSALIMALWALLLLSTAIFAWLKFIDKNVTVTVEASGGLDAKAMAHTGIVVALNKDVTQQTPLLKQQFDSRRGYEVQMTGEGGRLDLNWLFASSSGGDLQAANVPGTSAVQAVPAGPLNPDPVKIEIFQRYLARRGLPFQDAIRLTNCILDWLDPDNIPRLGGAEDEGDYHPPNRGQFLSVQELAQVKDSLPLVSQAGWQDDFTIYSGHGVDLQSASEMVLKSLPRVGEANVDRFLQLRRGPDGRDGTRDDHIFQNATEALSYLGVTGAPAQQMTSYVTVEKPLSTVHLVSTGTSGPSVWRVEVVAKKMGIQPTILSWTEP